MKSSSSREYHHQEEHHFEQKQQQTFQTSTTKISETNQVKEFKAPFHNKIEKITILFFFLLRPYINNNNIDSSFLNQDHLFMEKRRDSLLSFLLFSILLND